MLKKFICFLIYFLAETGPLARRQLLRRATFVLCSQSSVHLHHFCLTKDSKEHPRSALFNRPERYLTIFCIGFIVVYFVVFLSLFSLMKLSSLSKRSRKLREHRELKGFVIPQ